LVVETKRYLPYASGLKVLIPVIDAWARSREVIRQDVMKCLEEPRLGMAWGLGILEFGWRRTDTLLRDCHWGIHEASRCPCNKAGVTFIWPTV
jgi:hypothetical protein